MKRHVLIAIALFLAGPVLAIMALAAVRRLERESPSLAQIPQLTSRIYTLEKRMVALEAVTRQAASAQARTEDVKESAISTTQAFTEQVRVKEPVSGDLDAKSAAPPPPSCPPGDRDTADAGAAPPASTPRTRSPRPASA